MKKISSLLFALILLASTAVNAQYLDATFWASSPSDATILDTLYGASSTYAQNWNTNSCNTASMSVVQVPSGSALNSQTINDNTVYVLAAGNHIITSPKTIQNTCTAIVGNGDVNILMIATEPLLSSPIYLTAFNFPQTILINGISQNIILDNVDIDGAFDGSNTRGNRNTYGIQIDAAAGNISDNTFNNLEITNTDNAMTIQAYGTTNAATYNSITNSTFDSNGNGIVITSSGVGEATNNTIEGNTFSNNDAGITIAGNADNNDILNNTFENNTTGIDGDGAGNNVDSNIYSGNTNPGNTGTNASGTDLPTAGLVEGDMCTNPVGCECTANSSTIANGVMCSDGVATDTTTDATNVTCSDPDGCTCNGTNPVAYNATYSCSNGTKTTVTNGQTCSDPDGCICGSTTISNGGYCSISSGGGGGGGGSVSNTPDYCPNGDYTSSYYDGSCGAPSSNGELSLGGVVNDDQYISFSVVQKALLLSNEYAALVEQGETTLRHGLFFGIIAKYAELKNISDAQLRIIIGALVDVFSKMSETTLAKYDFDKELLLQELERLKS